MSLVDRVPIRPPWRRQRGHDAAAEPARPTAADPAAEPVQDTAAEPELEPADDPAAEPAQDPAAGPAQEPAAEPAAAPTPPGPSDPAGQADEAPARTPKPRRASGSTGARSRTPKPPASGTSNDRPAGTRRRTTRPKAAGDEPVRTSRARADRAATARQAPAPAQKPALEPLQATPAPAQKPALEPLQPAPAPEPLLPVLDALQPAPAPEPVLEPPLPVIEPLHPLLGPSAVADLAPGSSRDVRVMLVEDVPQVAERVRELLRSQTAFKLVAVTTDGRRVEDDLGQHRPDVVIVDTLLQGRVKGPAVIERLRRMRHPLPCMALTVPDRPLEAAVADRVDSVVTLPFGTFDLVRGIRAAVTAGAARNPTLACRMVAVFSAKGGVGKTTIALNLAVALKDLGLRTALVDGSLQFGDVRRLLGASSDLPSIIDLPTDSVRSSDLAELMVVGPSGIEVLLAPPRLEQGELVTTRDLDKILDMLRRTYHAVVIDLPSSLGETTLAFLDAADVILQVVSPETTALDITRLATEAFAGIGYPTAKLELLLNRADAQGSVDRAEVRGIFGRDPDHTVASDWALVARSNAHGVPFVLADPEAEVSRDMRALAARIAMVVGAAPRDAVTRRGRVAHA